MLPQERGISMSAPEAMAVLTGFGHYLALTEPERTVVEKLATLYSDNRLVRETGRTLLERTKTAGDMAQAPEGRRIVPRP